MPRRFRNGVKSGEERRAGAAATPRPAGGSSAQAPRRTRGNVVSLSGLASEQRTHLCPAVADGSAPRTGSVLRHVALALHAAWKTSSPAASFFALNDVALRIMLQHVQPR
ncbi:uncharacterized protein LOC143654403 [Tamandua tetradactyla]|uniref:uncharacterized protein LOC143654403 n=1 Tax=Tamandua tetradactyla TaxID=48850 RepID=UPI00405440B7